MASPLVSVARPKHGVAPPLPPSHRAIVVAKAHHRDRARSGPAGFHSHRWIFDPE